MQESERRQRFTGAPRMNPDEIAGRAFATARRGYAEQEVRSFLRRVAEELAATRERERELLGTLDELEQRLRVPRPLDEAELLDALGEETARLLRAARGAAEDIRSKAEDRVARLLDEAQADARRLREEAQADARRLRDDAEEVLSRRTGEAEAAAAALLGDAEEKAAVVQAEADRYAEVEGERARTEAEAAIEAARSQGREMLEEAKAVRERVLGDLARRRHLLQTQVEELRAGRDALLDAYRVVKRTFLEATEALAQAEARAAARPPSAPESTTGAAGADLTGVEAGEAAEAEGEEQRAAALADVDSLFARLRAGASHPEPAGGGAEAPAGADAGGRAAAEPAEAEEAEEPAEAEEVDLSGTGPAPAERWRATRDEALAPVAASLLKAVKRSAQDEQNALLDAVRRTKGRPVSQNVLPPLDDHLATWSALLLPGLEAARSAGRAAVGPDGESAGAAEIEKTVRQAAEGILVPLRERLGAAIDEAGDAGADTTALLAERIGARCREWRAQSLEALVEEAVAAEWTRGVYSAAPEGSLLQWVPAEAGRCADCDDNALEPTVKGALFPTGQLHPPAHPGCRCLLAPADVLTGLAPAAG